ncbi:MAG: hypothetical protein U0559_04230 [Anaerolineae bacterium]
MSPALEEVVGNAIIDREFRAGLLNGRRARLLSQFDLSPEEHQVLMNIRAESLESFASQLYGWVQAQHAARPTHLLS